MRGFKVVGEVYETDNYSVFKKLRGNRKMINSPKLKKDLLENGQQSPIIVNENMEVLDGQHRLKELEDLGLPVQFIIREDTSKISVISINNTQRNWKDEDYLNFYADNGNPNYIDLRTFYLRSNISLSLCITAGMGRREGSYSKDKVKFREGTFDFNNRNQLIRFNTFINRLELETRFKLNNSHKDMLWTLYTNRNFDEDRMIEKFLTKDLKSELFGVKDRPTALRILMTAYNDMLRVNSKHYIVHSYDSKGRLIIEK